MKATALSMEPTSPLVDLLDEELGMNADGLPQHLWERALAGPAREFLRRPGKQFRARLVEIAWMLAGGAAAAIPRSLPLIVELLHAGSLIVDDIEDGSERRRGGPALHHAVGVPVALNTGNWLYFWPLELIDRLPYRGSRRARLLREARTAVERCHRGQALDLSLRVPELVQSEIPWVVGTITRLKTGALMELSAAMGSIAAGADSHQVNTLRRFARTLGAALQMLDDLGGVTCAARRDKGDEDLRNARPTWPWAWLANGCDAETFRGYQRLALCVSAKESSPRELADLLRDHVGAVGRERVHGRLQLALAELEAELGGSTTLELLRAEIARLEASYV